MGSPAFLSKLSFLVIAAVGLQWGATSGHFRIFAYASALLLVFFFAGGRLWIWSRSCRSAYDRQHIPKNQNPYWPVERWTYVFLWLPALLWGLSMRLDLEPKLPEAPEIWRQWEKAPPNYKHALVANAKISKQIGLGRFLVKVRLLREEVRKEGRYGRHTRKLHRRGVWKRRRFSHRAFRRNYWNKPHRRRKAAYVSYRSRISDHWKRQESHKRKLQARIYKIDRVKKYKKRSGFSKNTWSPPKWLLKKSFASDSDAARIFPAILALSGKEGLYAGCRLLLRVYGRGGPRPLSGGFADWVHRQGAQSYWRASAKYHLLNMECPEPGLKSRVRLELLQLLKKYIKDSEIRNLMQALLLGRSSYLSRKLKKKIRELGILHLFAASGLHLGIFYMCFYVPLGRLFGRRHPLVLLLSLVPCGFVVWFLDFPVSIVRAFLFLGLHSIFLLAYRKLLRSHLLLSSMVLVVFYSPGDFLGIGSLLSFGAVTGILAFFPVLDSLGKDWPALLRLFWKQYALGLSAGIFTTPLLLYYFRAYGFLSPLANLVFVPLMGILLPLLYLGVFLALLGVLGGGLLGYIFCFLEHAFRGFLYLVEQLPGGMFYAKFDGFWSLPVLASGLLLVSLLYFAWLLQKNKARQFAGKQKNSAQIWQSRATWCFRCLLVLGLLLLGPVGRAWG